MGYIMTWSDWQSGFPFAATERHKCVSCSY